MPRLLVFQHVAAAPLGTLDALVRRRGHRVRFVNFERHPDATPRIDRYRGLIVLGGPMNVEDQAQRPHLRFELQAIEAALKAGKPVLGICLGAQLLAHTLGADVSRLGRPEIGWHRVHATKAGLEDPVLSPLGSSAEVFGWHGCRFDIPKSATQLCFGDACAEQAFRYGERAYGLQFHLEMDLSLVTRWLQSPLYGAQLEAAGLPGGKEALLEQSRARVHTLKARADAVFNRFLDKVGQPRRRHLLPSR